LDADLRGFVEHNVCFGDGVGESVRIPDVGLDDRRLLRHVIGVARREVVVDRDRTVLNESVSKVTPDEARTTSDESVVESSHRSVDIVRLA